MPTLLHRYDSVEFCFNLTDSEYGDSHFAGGRLQHRPAAKEPREEPLHGCPTSRPLPPLPHHY